MPDDVVIPWRWVTPLEETNGSLETLLARLEPYREAWEEFIAQSTEEERAEALRRNLRRHAIETGIIERLYSVSRGVTETLVAEGLIREVAEREEGFTESDYLTIRTQFEALEFLAEAARGGRDLSVRFIRELHIGITRNQETFEAHDALGRTVQIPLRHGDWKRDNNHVMRGDGSLLQYTPYEHVDAEMDRLVELYEDTADAHPLVRAAWLHHRFVGIHPFEDGNGRVARALVLLVLLGARWAPLVIDRERRDDYFDALDAANDGDLNQLVSLFADLEKSALVSELQRPARVGDTAVEVARGYVERLHTERIGADTKRGAAVSALAHEVQDRLQGQLERLGAQLRDAFLRIDTDAHYSVLVQSPPDPEARYWYAQLVRAAKAAHFFANLAEGSWWVRLRLVVLGQELRYVVATQKVGHGETGILGVTVFSELVPSPVPTGGDEEESRSSYVPLFEPTSSDSVTLNHTETVDDRWTEICELIERTLAASVAEFGRVLG